MFEALTLDGTCLSQAGASWLRDTSDAAVHSPIATKHACNAFCDAVINNETTPSELSDPLCVFTFCDPATAGGRPCSDGEGGDVPPGTCLVDARSLPFPGRRPALLAAGRATTVTGTAVTLAIALATS
jgi:hypothetical protein